MKDMCSVYSESWNKVTNVFVLFIIVDIVHHEELLA